MIVNIFYEKFIKCFMEEFPNKTTDDANDCYREFCIDRRKLIASTFKQSKYYKSKEQILEKFNKKYYYLIDKLSLY